EENSCLERLDPVKVKEPEPVPVCSERVKPEGSQLVVSIIVIGIIAERLQVPGVGVDPLAIPAKPQDVQQRRDDGPDQDAAGQQPEEGKEEGCERLEHGQLPRYLDYSARTGKE